MPARIGGGTPRLQRIIESLQVARGPIYSTSPTSAVGVEHNAFARVLDRDSYGGNERLANSFNPYRTTALAGHGLLPRWEAIFGIVPSPTEDEPTRRGAVVAAWQKQIANNDAQGLYDAVALVLGPLFVSVVVNTPASAGDITWWPINPDPYATAALPVPWYSTRSCISIRVTQPANYTESAFLSAISSAMVLLDGLLPAYDTFQWFTTDVGSGFVGFYLDSYENLLRDVFDV